MHYIVLEHSPGMLFHQIPKPSRTHVTLPCLKAILVIHIPRLTSKRLSIIVPRGISNLNHRNCNSKSIVEDHHPGFLSSCGCSFMIIICLVKSVVIGIPSAIYVPIDAASMIKLLVKLYTITWIIRMLYNTRKIPNQTKISYSQSIHSVIRISHGSFQLCFDTDGDFIFCRLVSLLWCFLRFLYSSLIWNQNYEDVLVTEVFSLLFSKLHITQVWFRYKIQLGNKKKCLQWQ